MNGKEKRARLSAVVAALETLYPAAECALTWGGDDPWRLLVMGRLSAQCTDARVNLTAGPLFARFPDVRAMAEADVSEVEGYVRSCGLYHRKAEDLVLASRMILDRFGGRVPGTMDELLLLPGVGRKIANLILGDVFGVGAIVTDTHCIRICGRLGFYPEKEKNPYKIERILLGLLDDAAKGPAFCHRIVWFGRDVCRAQNPACGACPLASVGLCERRLRERTSGRDASSVRRPEKGSRDG